MAVTRADTLTSTAKKPEIYSDFLDSFAKSPFSNQLALVKNERSVSQSIKNILMTEYGERLFVPNFGSKTRTMLFEPNISDYLEFLKKEIQYSIVNFEPRAQLISVEVYSVDEHDVKITVIYSTINNTTPVTLTVILKRVR